MNVSVANNLRTAESFNGCKLPYDTPACEFSHRSCAGEHKDF